MNNYIKCNQDRWNNVKKDYTEPLTHEELEEAKKHPISVALTVGKKVPTEWFEKAKGKKILGLACGGGQQGPVCSKRLRCHHHGFFHITITKRRDGC